MFNIDEGMTRFARSSYHRLELLCLDLVIIYLAGFIAYIFEHRLSSFVSDFGLVCKEVAIFSIFYLAGFAIWKTYNSFARNLSSNDYIFTLFGLLTGAAITALFLSIFDLQYKFGYHDIALQFVFALIGMRALRWLARWHFSYYGRRKDMSGSYGLSDMALLNMELSELLSRDPIKVNEDEIKREMHGKRILVTGGAGSIGSELVKIIARYAPAELTVIDQAETPMHSLGLEIKREYPSLHFVSVLGDVCNKDALRKLFERHKPQIIFHAAAYKHVSMMEENPAECILNNVEGSTNMADLAVEYGAEKFVLISSDKAVNPTGIMGCSKRICEIYCQSLSLRKGNKRTCQFVTTRFGNVLGSNGSVVPIFREQIRRGGPVTVTDPEVIRYFMLVDEACELVLEAATIGNGGEIFVFDMGMPVKIADLAKKMIKISQRNDIKIEYVGLGRNEKLYEEVLTKSEMVRSTTHDRIKIAKVREYDFEVVSREIGRLIETAKNNIDSEEELIKQMCEIVPEFNYSFSV